MDALEAQKRGRTTFDLTAFLYAARWMTAIIGLRPRFGACQMYPEGNSRASASLIDLTNLSSKIKTSPELLAQNEWKSIGKNGEIDFYY